MAPTQSFDVTTGCDLQEVDNAINQALKEIRQRYDFKGIKANIEFKRDDKKIVITAPDDFKLKAVSEVLRLKLTRRKVPLKNLIEGNIQPASGSTVFQEATPLFDNPTMFEYDVHPDGDRFLLRIENPDAKIRELRVVTNRFEELIQQAPN